MKLKQLDIFVNEIDVKDLPTPHRGRKKFATMQEIYGERDDKRCADCKHCVKNSWGYYKCELWKFSHCASTDIRLKNMACNMLEVEL